MINLDGERYNQICLSCSKIIICNYNKMEVLLERAKNMNYICIIYPRQGTTSFNYLLSYENANIYEFNNLNKYEAYHNNTIININQNLLDNKLESKEITFNITSIHKEDAKKYISSIENSSTLVSYGLIYDVVTGPSYELIKKYYNYLLNKNSEQPTSIYIWNTNYGYYELDKKHIYDRNIQDLIGLTNYYNDIKKDIDNYNLNKEILIKLGESNGINYLLYGPPGTGKSSFVRTIATELKISIYVTKLLVTANEISITNMLLPNRNTKEDRFCIVLIEDFDRYLMSSVSENTMSAILNALDGIFPAFNIIRFFSVNNPELINKNPAICSRMNRIFRFELPNSDQICEQICKTFPNSDENMVKKFVNNISQYKLSMREIIHYICRYLNSPNPINDIMNNYKDWIAEIKKFENFKINHTGEQLFS
jgi:ATP-dependent 26S proteasome regulatory subunit